MTLHAAVTTPATWTAGVLERPGVRLAYHRTGDGDGDDGRPGLVLLHGGTDNGLCWQRVAQALEGDFTVVMPDARGHGRTETDVERFTLTDMVDDVAALIEHLGLAPATVMGHSMGAQMATELGARHPELVDRIVLEDPAYEIAAAKGPRAFLLTGAIRLGMRWMRRRSVEQIRRLADRMFKAWADVDKATWAVAQHQSSRRSLKAMMGAFDRDRDWNAYLRRIQAPTLLVTAEKGLIKAAEADGVVAALPNGSRAHIARAGHNIRRDNYDDFMAAVRAFLGGGTATG